MDEPTQQDDDGQARGANGKFVRTAETAERDARACELRSRGMSYRAIARELDYASMGGAYKAVQRALAEIVAEPAEEVRTLELERLDRMYEATLAVLEREHVSVSQGKVVRRRVGDQLDDDGQPVLDADGKPVGVYEDVLDDAPVLQAVDRLLKIQERRARLLGLDAAQKLDVTGDVRYEVLGVPESDL